MEGTQKLEAHQMSSEPEQIYKTFYDYKIYHDGTIVSPLGKKLKPIDIMYPSSHVVLFENRNGKKIRHSINLARIVFCLYSNQNKKWPLDNNIVIRFIDGDTTNPNFDNLISFTRKDYYNKMKYSDKQRKFNREKAQEIIDNYPITKDGIRISLKGLAKKYNCSLKTVQDIVHGLYYPELNDNKEV